MTEQEGTERGLLDTSVVIATDVMPIPGVLAISTATVAELHFGVPDDFAGLEDLIDVRLV